MTAVQDAGVATGAAPTRRWVRVRGIVQGVGFRPFVFRVATEEHVAGFVGNDIDGVFAEVEGDVAAVERVLRRLRDGAPPLARVDSIEWGAMPPAAAPGFRIVASRGDVGGVTFVPPDAAMCDDCRRELFDPTDRRFRYPFINCTNCGPRFTIARALPYDRANTTMAGFVLCPACRREYDDPTDRRHHAEPLCCPGCGPQVRFVGADGEVVGTDAVFAAAQRALARGEIVAVKGLGGYHLACDATAVGAVGRLRARKHRPAKPFAVMARDLDVVRRLAVVDERDVDLLTSVARPIVLVTRRTDTGIDTGIAMGIAPDTPLLGVMLPYSPLHHLLFAAGPGADRAPEVLVMTSGNLSDEPICHDDVDARARLDRIADAWLVHDRPIHVPCDDSVVRVVAGAEQPVRRSRGHSPAPLTLPCDTAPVLAVGGDLKSAFCLAAGRAAWMSQHLGDMGSVATLRAFERSIAQFRSLYGVSPERLVADLHPGYFTRQWADAQGLPVLGVQHHHAHAAALLGEHGAGPGDRALVFAFDGTGDGGDGTVWGGEALLARDAGVERVAHLRTIMLPGGDQGPRRPARVALAHLRAARIPWADDLAPVAALRPAEREVLERQLARGVASAPSSSVGRLFDAVSSMLDLRHTASYEGEAAIALETAASTATDPGPPLGFACVGGIVDPTPVLARLVDERRRGTPTASLAHAFHRALARAVADVAIHVAASRAVTTVGLTGGVFQNALLTRLATTALTERGFDVLVHRRVPPNDGGLAFGQAVVAAACGRRSTS
jgi:hydrogenase maturation protein HypF